MSDKNSTKGFLIGFLAGGAVGAITALLAAPKSGKELRGDIKHKSEEYWNEADKYYTETKHKQANCLMKAKENFHW
jgi:gas vesicle protein